MHKTHGLNEYNGVYVDDALISAKAPAKDTKMFEKRTS
jgi:hypothetical protein